VEGSGRRCWHARPQPQAPPTDPAPEPTHGRQLIQSGRLSWLCRLPQGLLACLGVHRSPGPRAGQPARPGNRKGRTRPRRYNRDIVDRAGNWPRKEVGLEDLSKRSAREVLDDHLGISNRWGPDEDIERIVEEDLRRNVAEDCVILLNRGTFRGHQGVVQLESAGQEPATCFSLPRGGVFVPRPGIASRASSAAAGHTAAEHRSSPGPRPARSARARATWIPLAGQIWRP
jgi:hypothetical protein